MRVDKIELVSLIKTFVNIATENMRGLYQVQRSSTGPTEEHTYVAMRHRWY